MMNKTRIIGTILLVGVLGLGVLGYAAATALTGREIIENVDAMGVHTGDSFCTAPIASTIR